MVASGWSDNKVIDRMVNQLVMEMNEINSTKPILVVAVAEHAERIPPALRATGRFCHELSLKPPDGEERGLIFGHYLKRDRVMFSGDAGTAASQAAGLTAGDIEEVCRRLILQAARCEIEPDGPRPGAVTISEEDVLKMLDRWKLTSGA